MSSHTTATASSAGAFSPFLFKVDYPPDSIVANSRRPGVRSSTTAR
jgi:hypothetical protein